MSQQEEKIVMNRNGELTGEGIGKIILWVVFLVLAGIGVYFLIKRLTG